MSEARIIVGEGYSKENIKAAMSIIAAQLLAAGALPAMKRKDHGPFNKAKEIERRKKQIEKAKRSAKPQPRRVP